jgi:hypothetical protein
MPITKLDYRRENMELEKVVCYPVLPIKKQIENIGFAIKLDLDIYEETWNKYPCKSDDLRCRNDSCGGTISFFYRTDTAEKRMIFLRLLCYKADKNAYVLHGPHLHGLGISLPPLVPIF